MGDGTMRIRNVIPLFSLLVLAAAVGCSDDDTTGNGGGGTGGTTTTGTGGTTTTGTAGSGGTGGSSTGCNRTIGEGGSSCPAAGGFGGGAEEIVNSVTADIVDLGGNPAANILAEVCGTNRCESASADASGHVQVNAGGNTFIVPRLLYGDGIDWVKFAAPLPSLPDAAFGTIHAVALPAVASGAAFVPGEPAVSGDVTLSLDAGVYVEFNTLYYCNPSEQAFRAATIPLGGSEVFPAIDPSLSLEQAYGLAPIDTKFCPAAQMTVPNTAGLDPNTPVYFYYQGTSIFEDYAPFGEWEFVSNGTVSGDGATISTDPAGGIPELGVIGISTTPP